MSNKFILDVDKEVLSKMRPGRNEFDEHIWECTECSYSHKKKTNTFRHVEAKHVSCAFLCPLCGQSNNCRNSLKQHLNLKHGVSQMYWTIKLYFVRKQVTQRFKYRGWGFKENAGNSWWNGFENVAVYRLRIQSEELKWLKKACWA